MKRAARAVSLAALVMTILPPLLFFADRMTPAREGVVFAGPSRGSDRRPSG